MTDMPTVAITQPTLPSPLPTEWQGLVDCFYNHFQALTAQVRENNAALSEGCNDVWIAPGIPGMMRGPRQDEIAAVMPAKVNAAVVLANANYQVCNGGFSQYVCNGYHAGVPSVIQLLTGAVTLGVPQAADALAIFEEFSARLAAEERNSPPLGHFQDDEDEMDEDGDSYDDLDTRYYKLDGDKLGQDVLDRFDDILTASFRPQMKAA